MAFLKLLQSMRTPFLNSLFQLVTYFGQELLSVGIICVFLWCIDKNFGYKMGFAFFAAGMTVQGLKITFRIDRPWVIDPDLSVVESARGMATGYSFPSGHTQATTTSFSFLATYFKKRYLKVICVLVFLSVAFSRMYLGCHTPLDVFVAMAVALFFVFVFQAVFSKIEDNKKYDLLIVAAMLIISIGIMIYSIILYKKCIDLKYALDCCKAGGAGVGFAVGWYLERKFINFDVKAKSVWFQICKVIVGVGIALVIKEIPKLVFGKDIIVVDFVRYVLVTLWVVAVFPMLIKWAKRKFNQ